MGGWIGGWVGVGGDRWAERWVGRWVDGISLFWSFNSEVYNKGIQVRDG